MTKTKAKRWLKAVRELETYYRGKEENDFCPLCMVMKKINAGCIDCLWVKFSGMCCVKYKEKYFPKDIHFSPVRLRQSRDPRWVRLSITRLKRWEKRLLAIIEGE